MESATFRLADYIVIIDLDESQLRHGISVGYISQRFPKTNWPEISPPDGVVELSQPQGWKLSVESHPALFFVNILTDMKGNHEYVYCLQVYEPYNSSVDDTDCGIIEGSSWYKPKNIVILSRLLLFDFFRVCLHRIHLALADSSNTAEEIVASLIYGVVIAPGHPPVCFSLGNERVSIRPPFHPKVPVTTDKVAKLFNHLGTISNVLSLISAVLTNCRIVFRSSSLSLLSDSCIALFVLLYPFDYLYTCVPVVPLSLLTVLENPTPYIVGLMSSIDLEIVQFEAVLVDLDVGDVHIPDSIKMQNIPEPFVQRLTSLLQLVMHPDLATEDNAYEVHQRPFSLEFKDKRLRACFILFFCELLAGYRNCLKVVRLHEVPFITFHQSAFLGLRGLPPSPFFESFFNSHMIEAFIQERALPYRVCDIFDELIVQYGSQHNDKISQTSLSEVINQIAENLETNGEVKFFCNCGLESQGQYITFSSFISHKPFALPESAVKLKSLNDVLVEKHAATFMKDIGLSLPALLRPKKVPHTEFISLSEHRLGLSVRRVEVLKNCLHCIFDSKISDAKKMLSAVELSMKSVNVQVALCQTLCSNMIPVSRATLFSEQFELIARLVNCALNQVSQRDEHGIAYATLYLSSSYCRRLPSGAKQFLFTCIQNHKIWENERFWEEAFFYDVDHQLRRLYFSSKKQSDNLFSLDENATEMWNFRETPSTLDVSYERLARLPDFSGNTLSNCAAEENSIVFGLAQHYVNLMISLKTPLNISLLRSIILNHEQTDKTLLKKSEVEAVPKMVDYDKEVSFNIDGDRWATATLKRITGLMDRICSSAFLTESHLKQLREDIPRFFFSHVESLIDLCDQVTSFPNKPEVLQPVLLHPAEHIVLGCTRVFLLDTNHMYNETYGGIGQNLLPAEGAIFLTNYRVIFKGQPCNPYISERVVLRAIPIMSIVKEDSIRDNVIQLSKQIHFIQKNTGIQPRCIFELLSSSFQIMTIVFAEEVSAEEFDNFRKTLNNFRWPSSVPERVFAYSTASTTLFNWLEATNAKHKFGTIRKSLLRFPLKEKKQFHSTVKEITSVNGKKPLSIFSNPSSMNVSTNCASDYLDINEVAEKKTNKLHYHYLKDYERLELIDNRFRRCSTNSKYELIKSYPCSFIVPAKISDENLIKISKGFKHGRFPVITWKSKEDSLLIRGSSRTSQNVVSRFKKQSNTHGTEIPGQKFFGSHLSISSQESAASSPNSELQDLYFSTLAQLSPHSNSCSEAWSLFSGSMQSLLSFDSVGASDGMSISSGTPEFFKRPFTIETAVQNLIAAKTDGQEESGRFIRPDSLISLHRNGSSTMPVNRSEVFPTRFSLYILGDRSTAKGLKVDKDYKFISVSYPVAHDAKVAFLKFLQSLCPGWKMSEEKSFFKLVHESSWMEMVSMILNLSCAIVDLIALEKSSVAICLEDGWDATCQISALSQLLLDPFYRTFDGFRCLVEKEWLAFGHRFSHRSNHCEASKGRGIAPMFLMFLDSVHQVLEQFPLAFEFNDYYLRFLAYHSVAACFRTFLLDSEAERIKYDSLSGMEDKQLLLSVWTYIEKKREKSLIFNNLCYVRGYCVLRPQSGIACLSIWSYYCEDYPAHGSPYDIEIAEKEMQQREEEVFDGFSESSLADRPIHRVLDLNYKSTDMICLDSFSSLLEKYLRMRSFFSNEGMGPKEHWQDFIPYDDEEDIKILLHHLDDSWEYYIQFFFQKNETLRVIYKGLFGHNGYTLRTRDTLSTVPFGHHLENHSAISGTCFICHQKISFNIPAADTVNICRNCGILCHDKCSSMQNNLCLNCSKANTQLNLTSTERILDTSEIIPSSSSNTKTLSKNNDLVNVKGDYRGWLMKRGVTFKQWKNRWFVLDRSLHKLEYFDDCDCAKLRGEIDLSEVSDVMKLNDCTLEILTFKRVYALRAKEKEEANTWFEQITATLSA
uniref:UDENN domain-containing protein n=1 Tax=Syphacia muris TaxID=451379 RepID=A0A0N5ALI1_9BILA